MKGTGSGRGESPEEGRAPDLRPRGKTLTRLPLRILQRKRCEAHMLTHTHTPPLTPDPGLYRGRAPVRVLGPGPGASREAASKKAPPPPVCFCHECKRPSSPFVEKLVRFLFLQLHFKNDADPLLFFNTFYFLVKFPD